jgi:hypothetical protein
MPVMLREGVKDAVLAEAPAVRGGGGGRGGIGGCHAYQERCITVGAGRLRRFFGGVARQVQECLAMLADLTGNPDRQGAERDAVLLLSALVGAISMARAVNDPDLSQQILASAAAALNEHIPNHAGSRTGDDHLQTGIGRTVTPAASGELPVPLRI